MVARPSDLPCATPVADTVAMPVFDDVQTDDDVTSSVVLSEKFAVAFSCTVPPAVTVALVTVIDVIEADGDVEHAVTATARPMARANVINR
jgi:hypothetical protein